MPKLTQPMFPSGHLAQTIKPLSSSIAVKCGILLHTLNESKNAFYNELQCQHTQKTLNVSPKANRTQLIVDVEQELAVTPVVMRLHHVLLLTIQCQSIYTPVHIIIRKVINNLMYVTSGCQIIY